MTGRGRTYLAVTGALGALFLVVLVRTAWVSDDAFITLRTVDNFLNGHGLRWNTAERVQSFTHPLWLLLSVVPYAVTGDPYVTSIWVSIVVSMLAFGLALATAQDLWTAAAGALLLMSSRAFVDYSTSGLENPLTHLLLAAFAAAWFRRETPVFQAALFVTGGLITLNRQDTLLLVLPAMIAAGRAAGLRRGVFLAVLGAVPRGSLLPRGARVDAVPIDASHDGASYRGGCAADRVYGLREAGVCVRAGLWRRRRLRREDRIARLNEDVRRVVVPARSGVSRGSGPSGGFTGVP